MIYKKLSLALSLIMSVGLQGCFMFLPIDRKTDEPELFTVAAHSLLGVSGYHENGPSVEILHDNGDILGKIHHPLIDIPFLRYNEETEWLIVNHSNRLTDDERFEIIQVRGPFLHFSTEHLRVITFPLDRGTTPEGVVYVFRDGILIREVVYLEVYITNEVLRNEFRQTTRAEIEKTIKSELPW